MLENDRYRNQRDCKDHLHFSTSCIKKCDIKKCTCGALCGIL